MAGYHRREENMEFEVGKRYIVADKTMKRHGNVIEITGLENSFGYLRCRYKTIKEVHRDDNIIFGSGSKFAKSLKPLKNDCILIYRKGDETIAINKTTGEKATAKCNPDDEYDFTAGAKLAFDRLVETEQPKVQKVREEEFKPYLLLEEYNVHYGYIGKKTPFKDAIGRELRIGDTVELYNNENSYIGEFTIVAKKNGTPFVMSIQIACRPDGEICSNFKIILKRRYEDIKHGEKVDDITYIKER